MGDKVFFDLRESGFSVYSLKRNGKSWVPLEGVSYPVGEDYSFSVGKGFGRADESYLSLPLSLLSFRVIELPFSDMGKIRELLPFEIEGLIIGDPKDFVFDARILGKKDDKFEVLVAYLSKDILRKVLSGLKAAGFDPRAVTSLELAHILGSLPSGEGVMTRILDPAPLSETDRMRAVSEEMESTTLDLRRDEFVFTADREKTRSSLKITFVLGVALLSLFLADTVTTIISVKRENQSLRDTIRSTYLGMFPGEKRVADEIYQTKAHLKELNDKKDTYIGVSPLLLLLDLSRISRPGVAFTEVTAERDLIVLKGECASLSDAQRIKNDLEEFLTGVNISDTKPSAQNRTTFTITAKGRKT
jgi:type II secretory pathway component PulL